MAVGMGSLSLGWSLLWGGGAHPPALGLPCVREGAALCTPPYLFCSLQEEVGCTQGYGLWGGEGGALRAHLREEGVLKGPKP